MTPRPLRRTAVAVAIVVVLLATSLPSAASSLRSLDRSELGARAIAAPAAAALLALPWAERAGFDPTFARETAGAEPAAGNVSVHLTLVPSNLALYDAPRSGAAPLSTAEIADRFGVTPTQYDALITYFDGEGLGILHRDPARLGLTVDGPADRMDAAFGTNLESGRWQGDAVRFPSVAPSLPGTIAPLVAAVSGLSEGFDSFSLPISGVHDVGTTGSASVPERTTDQITPSALHLAYGLNDLYNFSGGTHYATGKAIALLLWGDGFDPADLQTFFSQDYPGGFPQINISWYPVDGAPTPGPNAVNDPSLAPQELTLDLEYAGSAAPGATLDAVYAPDGSSAPRYSPTDADMEDALTTAVELPNVAVLSMSFGTPDKSDPSFQTAFEQGFAVAAQRGITVLAASGDNGGQPTGANCPPGGPAVQYPAASPQVLAVGGTSPTLNESVFGDVTGLGPETAWNGSGGGFSPTYGIPSWQSNSSAGSEIDAGGHRGIADVAGPATYNRFYYAGQPMAGNGTSFATPFWAGMVAEMDALLPRPLGFVDPTLYEIASEEQAGTKAEGLVDVQGESGPTCTPSAVGWDVATGWGSPRAGLLFDDLIGSLVDLNLSESPSDVAPGGTISVAVQVLNATSHRPIVGVPVSIALSAPSGYLGPCGSDLASVATTTNASGNASATLGVPACYLGATVSVSASVASGGYFGSRSTTVGVNLLGLAGFLSLAQDYPLNVVFFGVIMGIAIAIGIVVGRVRRRRRQRRARVDRSRSVPVSAAPPAPSSVPSPGPTPPAEPSAPPSEASPEAGSTGTETTSVFLRPVDGSAPAPERGPLS